MLLLPAVSKTFADSLSNTGASEHSAASVVLARKTFKSSLMWRRLVRLELDWCVRHFDKLTHRHRRQACLLLDWYYSQVGEVPDSWFALYDDAELYFRAVAAELEYCSRHIDMISARRRDKAVDLLESLYAANPLACRLSWFVLY